MHTYLFLSIAALAIVGCSPIDPSTLPSEEGDSAIPAIQQTVPMHQSGYILKVDGITGWSLKQNDSGQFIQLTFEDLTSCVRDASNEPCTAADLLDGMQLDIRGTGLPEGDLPTMSVTDARIIGTSRTFNHYGTLLSAKPDGTWRLTYESDGTVMTIPVLLSKNTICQDDGETRPCGSWMEGRGPAVTGEIRQGEQAVRATWIDLP